MRVGVAGFLPTSLAEINDRVVRQARDAGFSGVSLHLTDFSSVTRADLELVRNMLDNAGLEVAQFNVRNEPLVSSDETLRRAGVQTMQRACQLARWLNAGNLYVRPGSLNPAGHWTPHPLNTHHSTIARLVHSLREIATTAESEGVKLALEGHVISPLDSPERMREVIEAVDSPALGVNADPVNMVGSLAELYDTTSLVDRLFNHLGKYVVCAHAKDLRYGHSLVLHLDECVIGEGMMDQVRFLQRFYLCCPDGYVLIEHYPPEKIPAAKQALDRALAQASLTWDK